jgi:hypothetical protein
MARHDHVGEFVARVRGQLPEKEIVDEQELGAGDLRAQFAERAEFPRFGDVFEELMRFAVQDFVAAVDGGHREGLGHVTLPRPGRPEDEDVFFRRNEFEGREFEHVAFRQPRIVGPVEAREIFAIGQAGEGVAPLEQTGAAPIELVLHEPRHRLEKIHLVLGHLERAGFEGGDHAREAELAERAFEFRDRHGHAGCPG